MDGLLTCSSDNRNSRHSHEIRLLVLLVWTNLCFLLLIGATWRLWWSSDLFPQVPLLGMLSDLPVVIDQVCLLTLIVAVGCQMLAGICLIVPRLKTLVPDGARATKSEAGFMHFWHFLRLSDITRVLPSTSILQRILVFGLVLSVATGLLLVFLNQHRLQAWAYLAWAIWLLNVPVLLPQVWSDFSMGQALRRWRWLVIGVYFYSALSKFDRTFLETLGIEFLGTLGRLVGSEWVAHGASNGESMWLAMIFPIGELLVAMGLAAGIFSRFFCGLAVTMHLFLMLVLGPWGLNHELGVLIWNAFFIGQAVLLFWSPLRQSVDAAAANESKAASWILAVFLLWPLLQFLGWCDHWLAWELYAPRGSRVHVQIAEPALEQLADLQPYIHGVEDSLGGGIWYELRLDRWSLDRLHAPVYPQDRFQFGVARDVADRLSDSKLVRIVWYGPANRWTGRREMKILGGPDEVQRFAERFRVNWRPRSRVN